MFKSNVFDGIKEFEKFSDNAKRAIVEAFKFAQNEKAEQISPRHIFLGIISNADSVASKLMAKLGVDLKATLESLIKMAPAEMPANATPYNPAKITLNEATKQVIIDSILKASELSHVYVGSEHLLLCVLQRENEDFVKELVKLGISAKTVKNSLQTFATYHPGIFSENPQNRPGMPPGMEDFPEEMGMTSNLESFAYDLNEMAEDGRFMPVYGRDSEIERLIHILSRRTKSNPILVGEAGVGKTAIVEGLVQKIVDGDVPGSFKEKRIVSIDLASILAGSKIRGDVEERIIGIVKEAAEDKNTILFIDEIHMIVGAGSGGHGSMDIANILKPYLTNSGISLIGATTSDEYQRYFESDSALIRRFQPVSVDEINKDDAIKALENLKIKLEKFHNVIIPTDVILETVRLSNRFIQDRFLPDKAIDVLDEASAARKILSVEAKKENSKDLQIKLDQYAAAKDMALKEGDYDKAAKMRAREMDVNYKLEEQAKQQSKIKVKKHVITTDDIRRVVSRYSKVPVERLGNDEVKSLIGVEKVLAERVIGQPDAVKRVAAAIKRAKVGISNAGRPLASFLFLGPTGVGKTELAKVIASEVFGNANSLIQIDMSEYMESHSVSKLIGSPPGYVGFQDGGQLTEKIRRNPHTVILFDEIEKAHPELLNILLQLLEEGHIQDSKGRRVNCKNAVVILTSNIGAEEVGKDNVLGFSVDNNYENDPEESKAMDKAFDDMKETLLEELKDTLRPELLNRIDDVIVFRGLSDKDVLKIVKLEIEKLNTRIQTNRLAVAVTKGALNFIAQEGGSKEYGARNIRRKIQDLVENPLADLVLKNNLGSKRINDDIEVIKVTKVKDGLKLDV